MTEKQWLACTDPRMMLEFLQGKASVRKQGLFAVACCRRIWNLMDCPIKQVVEVAERYADGSATDPELASSRAVASVVPSALVAKRATMAAWLSTATASGAAWKMTSRAASEAAWEASGEREDRPQADLLRCIFGNPFRPATLVPAWQTPQVVALAQAAYEHRDLPAGTLDLARLAVLADALEDAGCPDADILGHLRNPGPHVRGCWAVDLLLGKG
jgi:hypothetical protein